MTQVTYYRVLARFPSRRADLTMFVSVLEGLHKPKRLIHTTSNWKVVHSYLSQDTSMINDKQTPENKYISVICNTI